MGEEREQEQNRKNTVLLIVISVTTLLVAIVGATFAYFTASVGGEAQNKVEVTTSAYSSTFTAYSSPLNLDIKIEDMLEEISSDDYSQYKSSESTASIEMKKVYGGVATCTYDLVYIPSEEGAFNYSAGNININKSKELTISGNSTVSGANASEATTDSTSFAELDLAGINSKTVLVDNASFTIDATGEVEKNTTLTWTFEARFYNLSFDQGSNAEKSFGGIIGFENLDCKLD